MNNTGQRDVLKRLRDQQGYLHPQWGDLNRFDAVVMNGPLRKGAGYKAWSPYMIHLSVTGRCNAQCAGCINGCVTFREDTAKEYLKPAYDLKPERDAKAVLQLIAQDNADEAVVCFYGGEPLLLPGTVKETIDFLEAQKGPDHLRYMLYTNGQLLDRVCSTQPDLLSKFWLISVSIDGRTHQHNQIRKGTDLESIHKNLTILKNIYHGYVLMWSTLREGQSLRDCFEEFLVLAERGLAGHFFWHWVEAEEPFDDFATYCESYEQELNHIIQVYLDSFQQGKRLSIIHINELILFLLTGTQRNTTGCGVEVQRNYDLVAGRILACADLGMDWSLGTVDALGQPHLDTFDFGPLVQYKDDLGCCMCGVHAYCGGRCPVEALNSDPVRLVQYCQLMRIHVGTVQNYLPKIKSLLEENRVSMQMLYDESVLLAQFTDVTP